MDPRRCSECGRSLDGLMAADHSKPGLGGLLSGEGEDRGLNLIAWAGMLALVFGAAVGIFAAITAGLGA